MQPVHVQLAGDKEMSRPDYAILVEQKKLATHFKDVQSFHAERQKTRRGLSKAMMAITVVAVIGNLAQALALATLMPLSKIEPVYLWVRPDGTVDDSISMSRLPPTQSKAVIDAALWEYVRLREEYSYDTARYAFSVVSGFSSPAVAKQYQEFFNYPNPGSPQITVGRRGSITVTHISSSDISPAVQQVRFTRTVRIGDKQPIVSTMTATIGYTTAHNLPARQRLTNPGGLLITSYQSSEDSAK